MKRINKKGFTLVELLAVIVVLAILILLALPKVTSMMESARKNSFQIEVENIIKAAKNYYSTNELEAPEKNVTSKGCFTVRELIADKYLDLKNSSYAGAVCVKNDGADVYMIISNKNYYSNSFDADTNKAEVKEATSDAEKNKYSSCATGNATIDDGNTVSCTS